MPRFLLALPHFLLGGPPPRAAAPARLPPAPPRSIDFARDVRPIFNRSCVSCHGKEKQRGGLRLDEGFLALRGGDAGPAVEPGDSSRSRLLHLVAGADAELKMPPGKRAPLAPAEVALLRAWIDRGAAVPPRRPVATPARSAHWAFPPIRRPPLPIVKNATWARNPIDVFVLARLEKEMLAPSAEADRATLVRRLHLDLLGLPPTPEEVDEYLADRRPDAYERLVERVLSSPHYGERWGRPWLDLARYADSDGYEKDTGRPFAWRYRHWALAALNRDLPYDLFAIDQLAGDLLPGSTPEQKAATGFHRNTLANHEGGVDREQFRVEAGVDRVNTTAKVFLGVTLGCAQCHDHKYDPFSLREYYQFFAYFNSDVEVNVPAPLPGARRLPAREAKALQKLEANAKAYRAGKLPAAQKKWEEELKPAYSKALPANVQTALKVAPAKRTPAQKKLLSAFHAINDPELGKLTRALAELRKNEGPLAPALALGPRRKTHVMVRGDFLRPGIEVRPGTPALLPALPARGAPTRLDLARWLVAPDNPLTASVAVNWAWHKHFGRGLVATSEDFGTQGERPSHPELLDWLAVDLRERGWSLKQLHRLIVGSATYRQSSHARPGLRKRDPSNELLAGQARARLEAEALRDGALAASGLLVRQVGGPSVRPPQPAGISELTYAGSARWVESTGPDRYRRGIYTWFQRTSPYPMLMTFDAPDSNLSCVRRERSNTPLQALTLLNEVVFVEAAQALARRVPREEKTSPARLRRAFRLCVARGPTATEAARLAALFEDLKALAAEDRAEAAKLAGKAPPPGVDVAEVAAWVALSRALMNLDEFVTRE